MFVKAGRGLPHFLFSLLHICKIIVLQLEICFVDTSYALEALREGGKKITVATKETKLLKKWQL